MSDIQSKVSHKGPSLGQTFDQAFGQDIMLLPKANVPRLVLLVSATLLSSIVMRNPRTLVTPFHILFIVFYSILVMYFA